METTITIPNLLFERATHLAQEMGISPNELFTRALESYLARNSRERVTQLLDEIYARERSTLDPMLVQMQAASLSEESW